MNREIIFEQLRKITGKLTSKQVKSGDFIMDKLGEEIMADLVGLLSVELLTTEKLQKIYPGADNAFVEEINRLAHKYDINTKERMAMFLAQVIHESSGFKKLRESLGYTPERLQAVFPNRFKTVAQAKAVTDKGQVAVGDSIYGGRMGNGSNNGDGYKYRGGGLMHTTGKTNYGIVNKELNAMGTKVDLVTNPDHIVKPSIAVESAMIFWRDNNLNKHADKKDVASATKVINGGSNGLKERTNLYNKAIKILGE